MSKIVWDKAGEHFYETGVDHGVLYPTTKGGVYASGVAWNGLTSVSESPSGAESTGQHADNIKYLNLISAEEFGATIEAFTYPVEFEICDGSAEPVPGVLIGQQNRRPFGMSYRTLIGNDLEGTEYGYKIHLIYGATASPSERAYSTVNDSPEAITFSWEVTTTPVEVPGYKPTASMTIESNRVAPANLAKLEDILYGTADAEPRLPMPEEVIALIGFSNAITITVGAPDSSDTILGKTVSDLETNINVVDTSISGRVLYVENFTEYSTDTTMQEGNYLVLNVVSDPTDAEISVELLGGKEAEKTPDSNGNVIFLVTNTTSQTIKVSAIKGKDAITKTYSLKNLELVSAASLG